jgi:anti-sigma regulatory factor (Ser/Thr protein kinase)
MDIREFDLVIHADFHEIPQLIDRLERFAEAGALPGQAMFKIQLALDELINNVIDHGYPDRPPGEISIHVAHSDDNVDIILTDDAALFDPFSVDTPDLDAGIEERPIGGLGVHLVRTLMSNARYSVVDGRNRVHLTLALRDMT